MKPPVTAVPPAEQAASETSTTTLSPVLAPTSSPKDEEQGVDVCAKAALALTSCIVFAFIGSAVSVHFHKPTRVISLNEAAAAGGLTEGSVAALIGFLIGGLLGVFAPRMLFWLFRSKRDD